MKKKTNVKALVVIIIVIVILIAGAIIQNLLSKVKENPISAVGNTSGNLNNGGYFAENNGRVYFSNSYDHGFMYSMTPSENDLVCLNSSATKNILTYGDYLYFYMDTSNGGTGLGYVVKTFGIYRSDLNGKKAQCLDREGTVAMQLVGNYIYYQRYNNKDFTKTYKVKTDKSDRELVSDLIINPNACSDGIIYYGGLEKDHYLYALDTRNDTAYPIYEGNIGYPQFHDNYIYFMDVSNNYRLCRYSLSSRTVEILTNDRIDTYNVGIYNIYYQKNDAKAPALMRMNLDGSNPEIVASGNYTDICLTSEYAYFREFGDDFKTYHTPVIGNVNVEEFMAAQTAAIENIKKR